TPLREPRSSTKARPPSTVIRACSRETSGSSIVIWHDALRPIVVAPGIRSISWSRKRRRNLTASNPSWAHKSPNLGETLAPDRAARQTGGALRLKFFLYSFYTSRQRCCLTLPSTRVSPVSLLPFSPDPAGRGCSERTFS